MAAIKDNSTLPQGSNH